MTRRHWMTIVSAASAGLLLRHHPSSSQALSPEMRELIALQDDAVCFSSEFSTFENVYLEYADIPTHCVDIGVPSIGIQVSPHEVTLEPSFLSMALLTRLLQLYPWQRRQESAVLNVASPAIAIATAARIKTSINEIVQQPAAKPATISKPIECLAGIAAAGGIFDPQHSNPFGEVSLNLGTWTVMWRTDGFLHTEGRSDRRRQEFETRLKAVGAKLVGSQPDGNGYWNSYPDVSFKSIDQAIRALI